MDFYKTLFLTLVLGTLYTLAILYFAEGIIKRKIKLGRSFHFTFIGIPAVVVSTLWLIILLLAIHPNFFIELIESIEPLVGYSVLLISIFLGFLSKKYTERFYLGVPDENKINTIANFGSIITISILLITIIYILQLKGFILLPFL